MNTDAVNAVQKEEYEYQIALSNIKRIVAVGFNKLLERARKVKYITDSDEVSRMLNEETSTDMDSDELLGEYLFMRALTHGNQISEVALFNFSLGVRVWTGISIKDIHDMFVKAANDAFNEAGIDESDQAALLAVCYSTVRENHPTPRSIASISSAAALARELEQYANLPMSESSKIMDRPVAVEFRNKLIAGILAVHAAAPSLHEVERLMNESDGRAAVQKFDENYQAVHTALHRVVKDARTLLKQAWPEHFAHDGDDNIAALLRMLGGE